jgi:hypothetical protein
MLQQYLLKWNAGINADPKINISSSGYGKQCKYEYTFAYQKRTGNASTNELLKWNAGIKADPKININSSGYCKQCKYEYTFAYQNKIWQCFNR